MNSAIKSIQYHHYEADHWDMVDSSAIVETPVSLTVNSEVWLTFMCTPLDLEAMAVGFLYNEGLINSYEEIASVRLCASGENVDIWIDHKVEKPIKWNRTSGCTGGVTSVEIDQEIKPISNGCTLEAKKVGHLIGKLFESQKIYRSTGGVHTSALSDGQKIVIMAEDIGRHNTLDKIAGQCLQKNLSLQRRIILTTGRISSEMLQKSARLRAPIVISRTAPSGLAIEMAYKYGITLIGYARRNQFNLYTHPERIVLSNNLIKYSQEPSAG
jgi:FdhD protein